MFNSEHWHTDMEVKLSISSSRRISFASDFKDFDFEVEELEKERDNPSYRRRVSYVNSDSDDDVESNYVNTIEEKISFYVYFHSINCCWIRREGPVKSETCNQ